MPPRGERETAQIGPAIEITTLLPVLDQLLTAHAQAGRSTGTGYAGDRPRGCVDGRLCRAAGRAAGTGGKRCVRRPAAFPVGQQPRVRLRAQVEHHDRRFAQIHSEQIPLLDADQMLDLMSNRVASGFSNPMRVDIITDAATTNLVRRGHDDAPVSTSQVVHGVLLADFGQFEHLAHDVVRSGNKDDFGKQVCAGITARLSRRRGRTASDQQPCQHGVKDARTRRTTGCHRMHVQFTSMHCRS
jgi:hypothetical protein